VQHSSYDVLHLVSVVVVPNELLCTMQCIHNTNLSDLYVRQRAIIVWCDPALHNLHDVKLQECLPQVLLAAVVAVAAYSSAAAVSA
jgi:hypothetical protein